jgi:hypothetical protein
MTSGSSSTTTLATTVQGQPWGIFNNSVFALYYF